MSADQTRAGFDPEAEQEVDFGRYVRLIAARWWLLAIGLVLGAVIGYASRSAAQTFKATATVYLGQPYSASGNVQLQSAQTNPSTVEQIAHAEIDRPEGRARVQGETGRSPGRNLDPERRGEHLEERPDARSSRSACRRRSAVSPRAPRTRSRKEVVDRSSAFANQKIANFSAQISSDEQNIAQINNALDERQPVGRPTSSSFRFVSRRRRATSCRRRSFSLQAKQVEKPGVLTGAAAQRITARSRRNTVVVAALIGSSSARSRRSCGTASPPACRAAAVQ